MSVKRPPVKKGSRPEPEKDAILNSPEYPSDNINTRHKSRQPPADELREELTSFRQEMREMKELIKNLQGENQSMLRQLSADVNELRDQNKEIHKTNLGIQESISFISKEYEDIKLKINNLEKEKLEQAARIASLEDIFENFDRNTRVSKIEIRNVPEIQPETKDKLTNTLLSLSKMVKLDLVKTDLRDIHRLPSKGKGPKPIVADFYSPSTKENLLRAVRTYNNQNKNNKLSTSALGVLENPQPVYVAENLSPITKKLFFHTREFARKNEYSFCWTSNGRVFLRKAAGTPHIWIKSESQLESLKKKE